MPLEIKSFVESVAPTEKFVLKAVITPERGEPLRSPEAWGPLGHAGGQVGDLVLCSPEDLRGHPSGGLGGCLPHR